MSSLYACVRGFVTVDNTSVLKITFQFRLTLHEMSSNHMCVLTYVCAYHLHALTVSVVIIIINASYDAIFPKRISAVFAPEEKKI